MPLAYPTHKPGVFSFYFAEPFHSFPSSILCLMMAFRAIAAEQPNLTPAHHCRRQNCIVGLLRCLLTFAGAMPSKCFNAALTSAGVFIASTKASCPRLRRSRIVIYGSIISQSFPKKFDISCSKIWKRTLISHFSSQQVAESIILFIRSSKVRET